MADMSTITAREAARMLRITTHSLYRRVNNGEIPTVEPGEDLQPCRGYRALAFDRDVIAGLVLRRRGRPRVPDDDRERTFVRVLKRELQAWQRKARENGATVGEWLRALANAEARRATLKIRPPEVRQGSHASTSLWVRSSRDERDRWQVAAGRLKLSTNQWLRYIANAATAE